MNYILFDDETRLSLLPFTFTRPVSEVRMGILTISEKWERFLGTQISYFTEEFLKEKFPLKTEADNVLINGSVLPDAALVKEIAGLKAGERLVSWGSGSGSGSSSGGGGSKANDGGSYLVAWRVSDKELGQVKSFQNPPERAGSSDRAGMDLSEKNSRAYEGAFKIVNSWDIFAMNERAIADDFKLVTAGRKSQPLSATNMVLNGDQIFIEEGAKVEFSILNASEGPIYIGKDAEVMEGSAIRGPFSLGEGAWVRMGAKIYGATTVGPYCRIGGEVNNSVLFAHSNKAHDGFLGDSVIGEWCNLGADTNNSNLKNNYSQVRIWSFRDEAYMNTGLQFCGLMMGDHSKCSINTMFNTGTVVGISANIFGTGFPPKIIPSFSWGGSEGFTTYRLSEAMEVAQRVYERRKKPFDEKEQRIMKYLFDLTTKYRAW